jgi:hypothetical protein
MPANGANEITALAAFAAALVLSPALAAPPLDAEIGSPMALWFRSLRQPGTGALCCDVSDCRQTQARRNDNGWLAMAPTGAWVPVPPGLILADKAHPGGAAILCWRPAAGVVCFVPPVFGG